MASIDLVNEEKSEIGQLNVKIPRLFFAPIDKWLEKSSLTKWKAAVAAFRLLRLAPPDLKDLAVSRDDAAVRAWFRDAVQATMEMQSLETVERLVQRLSESRSGGHSKEGDEKVG